MDSLVGGGRVDGSVSCGVSGDKIERVREEG